MLNKRLSLFIVSPATAKVSASPSDKNNVKHISHITGVFLKLLMRLIKPRNKIKRDTDFLGYEAYSSISLVVSGSLPQANVTIRAKKPGSVESSNESFPLKAA